MTMLRIYTLLKLASVTIRHWDVYVAKVTATMVAIWRVTV